MPHWLHLLKQHNLRGAELPERSGKWMLASVELKSYERMVLRGAVQHRPILGHSWAVIELVHLGSWYGSHRETAQSPQPSSSILPTHIKLAMSFMAPTSFWKLSHLLSTPCNPPTSSGNPIKSETLLRGSLLGPTTQHSPGHELHKLMNKY
jgi:hypothetical protein